MQRVIPYLLCCALPLYVLLSPLLWIWLDRRGTLSNIMDWLARHSTRHPKEEEEE
jgi:hypothetical protein